MSQPPRNLGANAYGSDNVYRVTRPLHLEFPGAIYHVTSRGDRRGTIYRDDTDRLAWQEVLALVCERYHFVVHSFCQMSNHYHLLVETREANLSQGTLGARRTRRGGIDAGSQRLEVHMLGQADQWIADFRTAILAFMFDKQTDPGLHHRGYSLDGGCQNFIGSGQQVVVF